MEHIYNIIKFLLMFIFQLVITIIGIVLIPIFMFRMEKFKPIHKESRFMYQRKFKDKWFDGVFGNKEDGIGDKPYYLRYKKTWLRKYNWLAFRNPIHNLALKMGVDAYIVEYKWVGNRYTEDTIGKEGFVYSKAKSINGKTYLMYRWCKLFYKNYGIEMNIGYKNFNITEVPKHYTYSFTVSINPFKKFEPKRM